MKEILMYLGILSGITTTYLQCFLLTIPILYYFDFRYYNVKKCDNILVIRKKVNNAFVFDDYLLPLGLFYGKYYIGYIYEEYIVIICSKERFDKFTENEIMKSFSDTNKTDVQRSINLYVKCSNSYTWCSYNKRKIFIDYHAYRNQEVIIDEISQYYQKHKFCVSFIDGDYGSGKTTIAFLLANQLNGSVCKSYSPIIPGDNLDMLYNDIRPSSDNPLIILLDEVDVLFDKIHNNTITLHKNIPIQVYNKTTWNSLIDDFTLKLYPYVILILISNKNIETIKSNYDASFIRENRVNLFFSIYKEIQRNTKKSHLNDKNEFTVL